MCASRAAGANDASHSIPVSYTMRVGSSLFPVVIGPRIRGHPTGPPSAQKLTMTSRPSAQEEGILSRNLEHKSFISKPLESKTQFIALSDRMVTGRA